MFKLKTIIFALTVGTAVTVIAYDYRSSHPSVLTTDNTGFAKGSTTLSNIQIDGKDAHIENIKEGIFPNDASLTGPGYVRGISSQKVAPSKITTPALEAEGITPLTNKKSMTSSTSSSGTSMSGVLLLAQSKKNPGSTTGSATIGTLVLNRESATDNPPIAYAENDTQDDPPYVNPGDKTDGALGPALPLTNSLWGLMASALLFVLLKIISVNREKQRLLNSKQG